MPEEQAFAVLVKIMYEPEYGLREMFMNKFIELHVKFYQLERLIEVIQLGFLLFQTYIKEGSLGSKKKWCWDSQESAGQALKSGKIRHFGLFCHFLTNGTVG